jgi:hypothetical protein
MELWKDVKGYEGFYEVSNLGRVRRVCKYVGSGLRFNDHVLRRGGVLKQNKKRNGYLTVDLSKDNTVKTISVHRIVAEAFLEKIDGKDFVNHKNCNREDNRVENLEWCTPKENSEHAKRNGCFLFMYRRPVRCKQTGTVFDGSYKAAEWVNDSKYHNAKQVQNMATKIRACCNDKQKTAYGYTWEYI